MNRRSSTEWETLVRQFQQSGMTQKEFCETYDIKYPTLSYWVRKIHRMDRGEDSLSIVELAMPPLAPFGGELFSTVIQTEGITLELPGSNGSLRITGSISLEQLGKLIQACSPGENDNVHS